MNMFESRLHTEMGTLAPEDMHRLFDRLDDLQPHTIDHTLIIRECERLAKDNDTGVWDELEMYVLGREWNTGN